MILIVALTLFKIPHVFDIGNTRHHDFISYLQQASAYLDGETNYLKISSEYGPHYYPAGHLYHYALLLKLLNSTSYGELIFKLILIAMNLIMQLLIAEIAYLYWTSGSKDRLKQHMGRAQTVSLIYCANHFDKINLWLNYHNDNIMSFYLVVALYFLVTSRPIWGSAFLSIGLSVKAGAILMLPTFLGSIQ